MDRLKKILAVLLALIMGILPTLGAMASEGLFITKDAPADSDYDGIPDVYDAAPNSNVFTGRMKSGHDGTTSVSYTMDLRAFFAPNTEYRPDIATVSVIGSALAYYTESPIETYVTYDTAQTWEGGTASTVDGVQLLQLHGFKDVKDYTLDSYGDDDICEMIIGHNTVTYDGMTKVIVAIFVRGTEPTSEEEWSSNFNVGDLVRFFDEYDSVEGKSPRQRNDDWTRKTNHRGFDVCATRLLNYLKTYYFDGFIAPALSAEEEASVAYWLTGHSRGAAVANLMASYLVDEGEEVFAYTFAAPYNTANTEASAAKYDCIFNLVNSNDFVPTLPMPEWGFTRYGKTALVDASQWASQIKSATGEDYDGKYLTQSDINTMLAKFTCITGENSDRNNPGKILGWREVYVYHCGHDHAGETNGNYQSTTFRAWGIFGPYESDYNNKYAVRLRKYSYWDGGICQTPAYCMQVLVELMVGVANGSYLSSGWTYLTSNKLADKFDFDKQSLISYATKLTEPHFMDTYSVIQAQINAAGDPGARFHTLSYYTAENADGGRPAHTHTYTYVPYEGHEPTCDAEGFGYRYCICSEANADYYDDYQKNVVIPALGHDWGAPEYVWSADHSTCTATHTCTRDSSHTETETVGSVYSVVTEPTASAPGTAAYTATFTKEGFTTQVFEVELPMLAGFTVTFVDHDGTVLKTQRVGEGESAAPPENPSREGYTFVGWDGDYTNVTADVTITAQYVINTYRLTIYYVYEDGTAAASPYMQTYEYGASYSVTSPVITGYAPDIAEVSGVMGAGGVEITVTYVKVNLRGDVDCDGDVDFEDVSAFYAFILNKTTLTVQGLINADMNGDGLANTADISLIYRALLDID
ncbi:MAG: InlB B-repeat-containing protein [Clostridiales bacterium]|nr:InlB B-repeat-containing protein [Clostridiales bacterium]